MIDGLLCIVGHDEGIRGEPFRTVNAPFLQARDGGSVELVMVHNEHLAFSYTNP